MVSKFRRRATNREPGRNYCRQSSSLSQEPTMGDNSPNYTNKREIRLLKLVDETTWLRMQCDRPLRVEIERTNLLQYPKEAFPPNHRRRESDLLFPFAR